MSSTDTVTTLDAGNQSSLVTKLHIVYALHSVGLALGAFGAASVVGSFLFGWPSIIAVIVSYIYRGDARGSCAGDRGRGGADLGAADPAAGSGHRDLGRRHVHPRRLGDLPHRARLDPPAPPRGDAALSVG
jgi:hypothetical protein